MRGSVTIWHDTSSIDADGYAPRVEVHVNIWRNNHRSADGHFDLFDIGFRFKEVRALKSLSMSLPFVVDATQIEDLFDRMHDQSTISAIFNETLTPGSIEDENRCFAVTHTENKKTQFYVWRCTDESRRLSTAGGKDDRGTIITIDDRFFKRLQSRVGDHYLRLRIKMPIGLPNGFVSTSDPKDSVFLSTISTNEIVEFRLNERRNFSTEIRDRLEGKNCGLIDISAVHYFLIRDMSVEMTQSHAGFRKMRRLEPGMWTNYLPGADFNPDEMIIYHWASFADKPSGKVDSFNALATFRAFYTGKLWIYALVIIMLGAMGSALQASIVAWLSKLPLPDWLSGQIGGNTILIVLLGLVLFTMVKMKRLATRLRG